MPRSTPLLTVASEMGGFFEDGCSSKNPSIFILHSRKSVVRLRSALFSKMRGVLISLGPKIEDGRLYYWNEPKYIDCDDTGVRTYMRRALRFLTLGDKGKHINLRNLVTSSVKLYVSFQHGDDALTTAKIEARYCWQYGNRGATPTTADNGSDVARQLAIIEQLCASGSLPRPRARQLPIFCLWARSLL